MNNKVNANILRRSTGALLFSGALLALCSAINLTGASPKLLTPQDNTVFGEARHQSRSLSFADRVAYQRAIEEVFWRHRIWPISNLSPKPTLAAVMSQAAIEKKVTDYMRNSKALEDDWQRPITAEQLQAEMERMAAQTKQPEVLREIFVALGNDPFAIAECLARPVLAERLVTQLQAEDEKPTTIALLNSPLRSWLAKAATQEPVTLAAVSANYKLPIIASCTDDTWTATTPTSVPSARYLHTAVWTGSEMIVWGGTNDAGDFNTGGRYAPSTDSWTATSTINAPAARSAHTAIWTGSEMIVWGGIGPLNTGGRYNPSTDSWTATSLINAPAARSDHTAVWTGSEMIVWGGTGVVVFNTGGVYNPGTDSWTFMGAANAPAARFYHTVVLTGNEMIVWGGWDGSTPFKTGGRYNLSTGTWTATSTIHAPEGRIWHTAVFTGNEMIVWGGQDIGLLNTGGRYNPDTDSWTATSIMTGVPEERAQLASVWTGSDMIVWGGRGNTAPASGGGRYDPGSDSWTATSMTNAPADRRYPTGVWSGSEMIIWGGQAFGVSQDTGGRYCAQSGPPIALDARVRRQGGESFVELTWSPADGGSVNVLRNGVIIRTTDADGTTKDRLGTQTGTFTYQVCETDSGDCSNEATVRVRGAGD